MSVDFDKIRNLLERVTSGNAGKVELKYYPERKTCTITWKRPRYVDVHKSWASRIEVLLYVKQLLEDASVGVSIVMESTLEGFTPED